MRTKLKMTCPSSTKQYRRALYHKHKEHELARIRKKNIYRKQLLISEKSVPCVDCGQRYPYYVMDFDHVPERGIKIRKIGTAYISMPLKALLIEIDKCEVVCANCHRKRTWKRRTKLSYLEQDLGVRIE